MQYSASVGNDIQLTAAHREIVRQNGVIDTGPFLIQIDHDFVRAELRTPADLPALSYFFRVLEEVRREYGKIYLLILIGAQVRTPPLENRRLAADWDRAHGVDAVAVVAPHNPLYVTVVGLVLRAISLVWRRERPSDFFTTEAEGLRWIEAQRRQDQRGAA